MLVKEVFETIESLSKNFKEFKVELYGDKLGENDFIVDADLNNKIKELDESIKVLNDDTSNLKNIVAETNIIDEYFLVNFHEGSLRLKTPTQEPELSFLKIANQIHNVENDFENVMSRCIQDYDFSSKGMAIARVISREIETLINVFNTSNKPETSSFSRAQKQLITGAMNVIEGQLKIKLGEYQKETDKLFATHQSNISNLEARAEKDFKELNLKVKVIKEAFNSTLEELNDKSVQMDDLLEQSANRTIAQDYDTSAFNERRAANRLRYGSLACMAIIIGIVCYSFYDSTHSGFDWESSIFRTVLVFILSIPAAYLSRESAKHREQQYNYHHTALDLKAITPYIASLPEVDQNRIKISIAERIFASRQTNLNQQDSFPLNTQELMMELIKKVDLSRKSEQQDKAEKGS